jgi:predicted dehydrogenase
MEGRREPVRLGVIGCGVIGGAHARAAAAIEEAELVALADTRLEAARALAGELGVEKVYGGAEALLADEAVEAVVLALPASVRAEICIKAFAKGKHVLDEKPPSMGPAETRRMIAAQGDLVGACCLSRMRLTESGRQAEAFVASGALGDLRVVRVRALHAATAPPEKPPVVWRFNRGMNAGGIMSNWGGYDLDYVLGVLGWKVRPVRVLGNSWTIPAAFAGHIAPGSDAETHVAGAVVCEGGVVILYERGEQVGHRTEELWSMTGTGGTLHFDIVPREKGLLEFDRAVPERGVLTETVWEGSDSWDGVHEALVRDFAVSVRTGRAPRATLEEALVVEEVIHGLYESARTGEAVAL